VPCRADARDEPQAPLPLPPPDPVAKPIADWVVVTQCAERVAVWQGDLSASERTIKSTASLVDLAKATAEKRDVPWPKALELVFRRWYADKPDRVRMPNWPLRLVEDWHDTVLRVDEQEARP
jgi:hypothetical protein